MYWLGLEISIYAGVDNKILDRTPQQSIVDVCFKRIYLVRNPIVTMGHPKWKFLGWMNKVYTQGKFVLGIKELIFFYFAFDDIASVSYTHLTLPTKA